MTQKKENPKISVIIPVYNVEKYLAQCLDSVINQTLKDIEIICVDDGSFDGSLEILNKYKEKDERIKILTQKNQYAGVARNNGLKVAKGKYLSFLDSDDFFEPTMLEDMYKIAEKDDSDIVVCSFYEYDTKTQTKNHIIKIEDKYVDKSPFAPQEFPISLFDFSSLNAWTKLFRRKLFKDNDLHFENCICCNDFTCVCTALAVAKKISVTNKPYIYYRTSQNNNLTANRHKSVDSFLFAAQKLEDNLKKLNLYNTFKQAFIHKMKLSFNWELSLCSKTQKFEKEKKAKEVLSDSLYKLFYGVPQQPNKYNKPQKRNFLKY